MRTPFLAAAGDYTVVGALILVAVVLAAAIMAITHIIGPRRTGPVKDMTYESGVNPIGDARRRFNVRFYIVAMLFLLFDVEIVFFYPWAVLFPRLTAAQPDPLSAQMLADGFGAAFFVVVMLIFIAVLLIGYLYAWQKGVFRWD